MMGVKIFFFKVLSCTLKKYVFIKAVPGLSCRTGDLPCGMPGDLSCGTHAGSSSLTRDRTWVPCIGSVESYPLDHAGSPKVKTFICFPVYLANALSCEPLLGLVSVSATPSVTLHPLVFILASHPYNLAVLLQGENSALFISVSSEAVASEIPVDPQILSLNFWNFIYNFCSKIHRISNSHLKSLLCWLENLCPKRALLHFLYDRLFFSPRTHILGPGRSLPYTGWQVRAGTCPCAACPSEVHARFVTQRGLFILSLDNKAACTQ